MTAVLALVVAFVDDDIDDDDNDCRYDFIRDPGWFTLGRYSFNADDDDDDDDHAPMTESTTFFSTSEGRSKSTPLLLSKETSAREYSFSRLRHSYWTRDN